jgi:hypothetical protein
MQVGTEYKNSLSQGGKSQGCLKKWLVNDTSAKGNECSHYESNAAIFSSSLPNCPFPIFLK